VAKELRNLRKFKEEARAQTAVNARLQAAKMLAVWWITQGPVIEEDKAVETVTGGKGTCTTQSRAVSRQRILSQAMQVLEVSLDNI
jgi:hypothetical protein